MIRCRLTTFRLIWINWTNVDAAPYANELLATSAMFEHKQKCFKFNDSFMELDRAHCKIIQTADDKRFNLGLWGDDRK